MSSSYSITESSTFTITHARHMAAKVATDLKRMQRFYGSPSDSDIADYETEVTELLKAGYLGTVTAQDLADGANDDDPGKLRASADISGATFYSYLTYSAAWDALNATDRDQFKKRMPYYRNSAAEPAVNGYLIDDRTYSSGGRALNRSSVRSFS